MMDVGITRRGRRTRSGSACQNEYDRRAKFTLQILGASLFYTISRTDHACGHHLADHTTKTIEDFGHRITFYVFMQTMPQISLTHLLPFLF